MLRTTETIEPSCLVLPLKRFGEFKKIFVLIIRVKEVIKNIILGDLILKEICQLWFPSLEDAKRATSP